MIIQGKYRQWYEIFQNLCDLSHPPLYKLLKENKRVLYDVNVRPA